MPAPISSIPAIGLGPEFQIPGIDGATTPATPASGGGFGAELTQQIEKLDAMQNNASHQAQALATGQADDVNSVVMEVERAALSLQLATQVRNKAVDAYQQIFQMHI